MTLLKKTLKSANFKECVPKVANYGRRWCKPGARNLSAVLKLRIVVALQTCFQRIQMLKLLDHDRIASMNFLDTCAIKFVCK